MKTEKRDGAYWETQYRYRKALWISDENPLRPHVFLTTGNHSSGFFNSGLITPDESLLRLAASDLVDQLSANDVDLIDRVVGPKTGATRLAEFIADEVTKRRGRPCLFASPRKEGGGADRTMIFDENDPAVMDGEKILLCDDVVSTGDSVQRTARVCLEAGGHTTGCVLALVNRSGRQGVDGKRIIALIDHPMPIWDAGNCPLCKAGSKAIPAKDSANWELLNAAYEELPL